MPSGMEPVHIYGPIAWFGADEGETHVDERVASYLLSQTVLPVPLLIEHDQTLQIGKVVHLDVEKNRLVATCVVDDSLFISLLNNLHQSHSRYRSTDIGTFLNILLPSFSSYHRTDTLEILEISLVDVGRREGALWSVSPHTHADRLQRTTTEHIKIPIEEVKTKLLTLLLRQRQQPDRNRRLCRDASLCGLSSAFVCASSLSPSSLCIEQSGTMAKPGAADVTSVLTALLEQHASETVPSRATEEASKNAIYSSEDVKQMMLNLEKKHADRAGLELAMEELVRRRITREEMKKERSGTGRRGGHRRREDEAAISEDELSNHEHAENSYTSVPVSKRVQTIMDSHDRPAKKAKVSSRRRPSNKVQDGSDTSDSDSEGDGRGAAKRQTSDVTSKMVGQLKDGLKQMVSMLAAFNARAGIPQQHDPPESVQQSTSAHTNTQDKTPGINTTGQGGGTSKDCVLGHDMDVPSVKASAINTKPRRSTVEQLFS